ncbi:MAG: hypothetical protein V3V99_01855 [candidate division Zixibacteria bacterium]
MHSSEYVTIQILNGVGSLPDDFENKLQDSQIAGLPVRIKKIGKRPMPGGRPIGIILTIPSTHLKYLSDTIDQFIDLLVEFYRINDNVCNCSLCVTSDKKIYARQTHIAASGMEYSNLKRCFKEMPGTVGSFIREVEAPNELTENAFVNVDSKTARIKDITCFDTNQDFYVYDPDNLRWVKQEKPEHELK